MIIMKVLARYTRYLHDIYSHHHNLSIEISIATQKKNYYLVKHYCRYSVLYIIICCRYMRLYSITLYDLGERISSAWSKF